MGGAMKYFPKKLLGHEIFRSMVSWATKDFLKDLQNPLAPPSYILNVQSLTRNLSNNQRINLDLDLPITRYLYSYLGLIPNKDQPHTI